VIAPNSASVDRAVVQRAGLPAFVELAARHKFGPLYVHGRQLRLIAEHCEALYWGEILTLLVSAPPGSMKSLVCSGLFPAWVWALDPTYTFMRASYDLGNAAKLAADTRVLCQSDWFRDRWGDFVVERVPGRPSGAGEYWTLEDGFSMCSSIKGGRFVGRHSRMMIVDDPIKGQNTAAADPAALREARDWYKSVGVTRAAIGQEQRMLVVAQRFHEEDLNGLLIEQNEKNPDDKFAHLMLPWHFEPERACVTSTGKDWRTKKGEELFDDAKTRRMVNRMLAAGPDDPIYRSQIQQDPASAASDYFPLATLLSLDGAPTFPECMAGIFVDPSFNGEGRSDDCAVDVWGYARGHFCCFYSEGMKRDFKGALEAIKRIRATWPTLHIVIELAANGAALVNMLEAEGVPGVVGITPQGEWKGTNDSSKKGRARAASFFFKSGRVHFDHSAPWWPEKRKWLVRFPGASHDDWVDTAVMGVLWLQHTYGGTFAFDEAMNVIAAESPKQLTAPAQIIAQTRPGVITNPDMAGFAASLQQRAAENAASAGLVVPISVDWTEAMSSLEVGL
jgi:phage terminase large subunit-like protein